MPDKSLTERLRSISSSDIMREAADALDEAVQNYAALLEDYKELESQLAAVGAGGVSSIMGQPAIRALLAERDALREALSELVACRDIKRRIAIEQETMIPETDDDFAELDRLMTDLANRQPKAWAAAEVALAQEQGGSDD